MFTSPKVVLLGGKLEGSSLRLESTGTVRRQGVGKFDDLSPAAAQRFWVTAAFVPKGCASETERGKRLNPCLCEQTRFNFAIGGHWNCSHRSQPCRKKCVASASGRGRDWNKQPGDVS